MLHAKRRILPPPLESASADIAALIDTYYNAYNAARLRESCQAFARMIDEGATIGVSISGALTPAGLSSVLVPLMQRGFIDYVSSTGANLYHDLHYDLGLGLYRGQADVASGAHDVALRKNGIIRVYDVLFEADVLFKTDEWVYRVLMAPEFGKRMSSAELHHRIGRYALETARQMKVKKPSILATCHALGLPVWSASPGDSTIGLNMSAIHTTAPDRGPHVDPGADVTEMSALVLDAKRKAGGLSGVLIFGGGAPKNFLLQTEPQLQEILGVAEKGHDFFVQITDARPDTGGLSGATPSEAVSWGKIDPEKLPDTVVCYLDSTVAMPLMAAYVLARCKPRKPRRLYDRLPAMVEALRTEYRTTAMHRKYWGAGDTGTKQPSAKAGAKSSVNRSAKQLATPTAKSSVGSSAKRRRPAPKRTR